MQCRSNESPPQTWFQSTQQHFAAQLLLSQRALSGFRHSRVLWPRQSPETLGLPQSAVGTEEQSRDTARPARVGVTTGLLKKHSAKGHCQFEAHQDRLLGQKSCSKCKGLLVRPPCALSGLRAGQSELHTMLETFPPSFMSPTQWVFVGLSPEGRGVPSPPFAEPCQVLP